MDPVTAMFTRRSLAAHPLVGPIPTLAGLSVHQPRSLWFTTCTW